MATEKKTKAKAVPALQDKFSELATKYQQLLEQHGRLTRRVDYLLHIHEPKKIEIKRFREKAILPAKATPGSAGMDVFSPDFFELKYGRQVIPCGWGVCMPMFDHMDSRPTSGYGSKGFEVYELMRAYDENFNVSEFGVKIRIEAEVVLGLIDSDYPKEVGVIINVTDERMRPNKWYEFWRTPLRVCVPYAHKLGQVVITPDENYELVEVEELSNTNNGFRTDGWGHTEEKQPYPTYPDN